MADLFDTGLKALNAMSGRRGFRRHLALYVAVNCALHVANIYTGWPWWAFWPFALLSLALTFHYFVYKSANVDESWVEERTHEVHGKSYDFGHIDDIRADQSRDANDASGQSRKPRV